MSKRTNMTMIGAFVLTALGLGVGATVVLASGALFRDTFTAFSLFDGSVLGLSVGAPVVFRGVQVGTVSEIRIMLEDDPRLTIPDNTDARIPVIYEIDRSLLTSRGTTGDLDAARLTTLVNHGLRAQLLTESFVTGRLIVSLDFFPEDQATVGNWPVAHAEIPTVPTPIEEIQHKIAGLFDELEALDISGLLATVEGTFATVTEVVEEADMESLTSSYQQAMVQLDATLVSVRNLSEGLAVDLHAVALSAAERARQLEAVFAQAQATMATISVALGPDSPVSVELTHALEQLGDAAHAFRALADAIEQNPSILVRGRAVPEGN